MDTKVGRKARKKDANKEHWKVKSLGSYASNGHTLHRGFDQIFANFNIDKLKAINQINLQNYYKKNKQECSIYCLICQLDIKQVDVFSHTISSEHRHNKLFYNFVQNRHAHGNTDYIIYDNRWALCRYCDNVIFSSSSSELCNHIKNDMHSDKKRYCLNRVKEDSLNNLANKQFIIEPQSYSYDKRPTQIGTKKSEKQEKIETTAVSNTQKENGVKSHTDCILHQRNELFYNFVQNRRQSGDTDYIILGNNWVLCRYCDHVILPSYSTELRTSHVLKDTHLDKKKYCLNRLAVSETQTLLVKI